MRRQEVQIQYANPHTQIIYPQISLFMEKKNF